VIERAAKIEQAGDDPVGDDSHRTTVAHDWRALSWQGMSRRTSRLAGSSRVPVLSLHGLERARTTVEDFCKSYLPLHGVLLEAAFLHLDVIVYVSASLYELDEANEAYCSEEGASEEETSARLQAGVELLGAALSERGMLGERVSSELANGTEYWRLERRLCRQLRAGQRLEEAEVMKAHTHKSFDYRVLHLLLYQRLGRAEDGALMSFLAVDERLVDIGDDLTDYEDDVFGNTFNIWRCLITLARQDAGDEPPGSVAARRLFELISQLEQQHTRLLSQLTDEQRRAHAARHEAASSAPGSERWIVPSAILNEKAWRLQQQVTD